MKEIGNAGNNSDSAFARVITYKEKLVSEKKGYLKRIDCIWGLVDQLGGEEAEILSMYYGRDSHRYTLQEIGNALYMSKDTVLRKKEKALLRLSNFIS